MTENPHEAEDHTAFIEELERDGVFNDWWYYSVELAKGRIANGVYPDDLPDLPRILLKRIETNGMKCLDVGTMEGVIPALWAKRGAKQVVATDCSDHCLAKIDIIKRIYGVDYNFQQTPPIPFLAGFLNNQNLVNFDVCNLSGVLYHVFSPMLTLCGVRPLIRDGGLFVVATNITLDESASMHFNYKGAFQKEVNTFWYMSPKCFDYILRFLKLAPIDCIWTETTDQQYKDHYHGTVDGLRTGYLAVVCRAVNQIVAEPDDDWMVNSERSSWEYMWYMNSKVAPSSDAAPVEYRGNPDKSLYNAATGTMDLQKFVSSVEPYNKTADPSESSMLRLVDTD